ncbi:MAG: aromatic amino acid ammonia-lyase, partial [Ignavibacteriaceae bacterium]
MAEKILSLDGNSLSINDIEKFVTQNIKVKIKDSAIKKMVQSRKLVEEWIAKDDIIYGVTTGFGEFSNVKISHNEIEQLQENLIVSHAVGCGEPLPPFIVKIMMLLRVNALAKGYSGIRPATVQLLVEMINNNIIPVVPSQGSVGSSGDLVQLSHLVLAMIGKGKVQIIKNVFEANAGQTKIISSKLALKKFGLQPVKLQAKEGLALINGTQMMTSFAAFLSARAIKLKKIADIAAALSHEALRATDK